MSEPAVFTFRSEGLELEFNGHEEFVSAQITQLQASLAAEWNAREAARVARPTASAPNGSDATEAFEDALPTATDESPEGDSEESPTAADAPPAAPVRSAQAKAVPANAAPAAAAKSPTLDAFYRRVRTRHGRGALQEMILICSYFIREYRDQPEFAAENLNACFAIIGERAPLSLSNTLGIMKRDKGYFAAGASRGTYTLTDKGIAFVRHRVISAQ